MKMLMIKAMKVELKATPRLTVTPTISPSTARWACPRAAPMPRTVPMKPMEGIAQMTYLIMESSESSRSDSVSQTSLMAEDTS